jgi:hypothetical protein
VTQPDASPLTEADAAPADPVEQLARWEAAGGQWRSTVVTDCSATVLLQRCDLGEAADTIVTTDPRVIGYLRTRASSSS